MSGRPSRDPKNVDYVPTLFKDGKRRANCSIPDRNREERSAKRAKVRQDVEDIRTAADDPNYLVPPNQKLSVEVAALQEELDSLKQSLPKSPLQLMASSNQKTKFYMGLPTYEVLLLYFTTWSPRYLV